MTIRHEQRSGLPLMILAGVALIAVGLVVWLLFDPFGWDDRSSRMSVPTETADDGAGDAAPGDSAPSAPAQPSDEPADDAVGQAESGESDRAVPAPETAAETAGLHTVRWGDTLFDIAGTVWADPYLWPLLLEANRSDVNDPDFLLPGQRITIPSLTAYSDSQLQQEITRAHLLAYTRYRELGDRDIARDRQEPQYWVRQKGLLRLNKSRWVLYSGLRYNRSLIEDLEGDLDDADVNALRGFVARYGYPPAPPSR